MDTSVFLPAEYSFTRTLLKERLKMIKDTVTQNPYSTGLSKLSGVQLIFNKSKLN